MDAPVALEVQSNVSAAGSVVSTRREQRELGEKRARELNNICLRDDRLSPSKPIHARSRKINEKSVRQRDRRRSNMTVVDNRSGRPLVATSGTLLSTLRRLRQPMLRNQQVRGSSPRAGSKLPRKLRDFGLHRRWASAVGSIWAAREQRLIRDGEQADGTARSGLDHQGSLDALLSYGVIVWAMCSGLKDRYSLSQG